MGLLPHVLHHIGLLAGTALVAGSGGTALFGALGLLASIPMLVRLYRRFGSWIAPALGLLVFAAMFSLSRLSSARPSAAPERDVHPGPGTHPGPHQRAHRRPLNTQEIPGHPGARSFAGAKGTWKRYFAPVRT